MSTNSEPRTINIESLAEAARTHAHNLRQDILNASDRIEHMRLTRLAIEAEDLATDLTDLAQHQHQHQQEQEPAPAPEPTFYMEPTHW